MKVKYLGKQPILIGHKFAYQGEVHTVTAGQWTQIQAQHDVALFQVLDHVMPVSKPAPLSPDSGAGENLNNQTEKPRRRRAKAG